MYTQTYIGIQIYMSINTYIHTHRITHTYIQDEYLYINKSTHTYIDLSNYFYLTHNSRESNDINLLVNGGLCRYCMNS